jgi:hypothetical protein
MRRPTRRVLWERAGQQPDRPNDDGDGAGQGDADDPATVETDDDVFGDMPSDPVIDAYDLPDDRLCSVDTAMSSDHTLAVCLPEVSMNRMFAGACIDAIHPRLQP